MNQPLTKDMTIGDVIEKHPETADVMLGYGLQCVGCSVNPYETIEQGVLGHGMNEDTLNELMADINLTVTKQPEYPVNPEGITLSPRALETLEAIKETEGQQDFGLKIQATKTDKEPEYYLDLVEKPEDNDKILEWEGMKLFISDQSLELMKPSLIDFLRLPSGEEGFKIMSLSKETCKCGKPLSECGCENGKGCACGSGGCC